MEKTRKLLAALPEKIDSWKPHEKSMDMPRLVGHVVQLPGWTVEAINRESLDITPPADFNPEDHFARTRQVALERFDRNVAAARAALAGASDQHLAKTWSLMKGSQTLMAMPRTAVIRTMIMNHLIHHRAQLGVYMRLKNIAIPGMYGPSADEMRMFAGSSSSAA